MNREELFYLVPYLFSLALSLGIFAYTWQHRSVPGARVYSWFVAGQSLTILGFIFELTSPSLEIKLFWDKFQWLTDTYFVIIPFLIFSVQFSEYKLRHPRIIWGFWLGIPILFTMLLLTDSLHHLIYPDPHLSLDYPFPELRYDFTIVVYSYALIYVYGANFYGISLLIRRALQPYNAHRGQYWTIAVGFLIPVVLSMFSLLNIHITPYRDISPFTFAIGNLVVAWGLFRYRLFDLVPIARERVLENMTDAVIVLDASNRVVDINQIALANIGKTSTEVIGHPAQEVFAEWSNLTQQVPNLADATLEVAAIVQGESRTYDLSVSSISDQRKQRIGRVFIAHDITQRKILEERYRLLSEELELRVHERTEDLRRSTERYRAVVENQTEFIVRWKADGVRTFVNETYCRYFGLTPEQAISSSFTLLVAEEDLSAVEQKLSRLLSGEVASETDIHRVIRPDGGIGWQEWVDQAIHDASGQIIEFQSVGRDITERKQAEEALHEKTEELERFFMSSLDLLCIADTDGYFRRLNREWEKVLGYRLEDLEGKRFLDLVHPDDREATLGVMAELDAQKEVLDFTNRYRCKDGSYRWFEWRSIPHGKLIYAAARDITERKQAEEELRRAEELFRAVVEDQTEMIVRWKPDGTRTFVNNAYCRTFGRSYDELVGTSFWPLVAEPYRERELERIRSLTPDSPYSMAVHESLLPDGTTQWQEWSDRGLFDEKGRLVELQSVGRDITERKQAEEALRRSERVLREAEFLGHTGSWEQNLVTGEIFNTEENLRLFFGDDRSKDANFDDYAQVVYPGDREYVMRRRTELLEEEGPGDIEYRVVWPDGSVHVIFGRATVVRDELGQAIRVYGTNVDITERKRAEEALRVSEDRLRRQFEGLPIPTYIWKREGENFVLVDFNEAADRSTSGGSRDWIGIRASDVYRDRPDILDEITRSHTEQATLQREMEYTNPATNEKYDLKVTYVCLPSDLVMVHLEDITERKRAEEEIRWHAARMEVLAEISQALAKVGLDVQAVFDTIARYTAEHIGDACGIRLLSSDEQWLNLVAFHHPIPETAALLKPTYLTPMPTDQVWFHQVLRIGQSLLLPVITEKQIQSLLPAEYQLIVQEFRLHSALIVPLRVEGRVIGTIALTRVDPAGPPYTPNDQVLLQELADRAGLTIQNARLFEQVENARERLAALSRRLLQVQEAERQALTAELHDRVGQNLTGLSINLQNMKALLSGEAAIRLAAKFDDAQTLVQDTTRQIRDIMAELHLPELDDYGLSAALEIYAERAASRGNLELFFDLPDLPPPPLPSDARIAVFRAAQEAISNVLKHAHATRLEVSLEERVGRIHLKIEDDGQGFEPEALFQKESQTWGLKIMRERIESIGGKVQIESRPGKGTQVIFEIEKPS